MLLHFCKVCFSNIPILFFVGFFMDEFLFVSPFCEVSFWENHFCPDNDSVWCLGNKSFQYGSLYQAGKKIKFKIMKRLVIRYMHHPISMKLNPKIGQRKCIQHMDHSWHYKKICENFPSRYFSMINDRRKGRGV